MANDRIRPEDDAIEHARQAVIDAAEGYFEAMHGPDRKEGPRTYLGLLLAEVRDLRVARERIPTIEPAPE